MQIFSLIPILILLLYLLLSIDLVDTGICKLDITNCSREEQQFAKLILLYSVAETMSSFSFTNNCKC